MTDAGTTFSFTVDMEKPSAAEMYDKTLLLPSVTSSTPQSARTVRSWSSAELPSPEFESIDGVGYAQVEAVMTSVAPYTETASSCAYPAPTSLPSHPGGFETCASAWDPISTGYGYSEYAFAGACGHF